MDKSNKSSTIADILHFWIAKKDWMEDWS